MLRTLVWYTHRVFGGVIACSTKQNCSVGRGSRWSGVFSSLPPQGGWSAVRWLHVWLGNGGEWCVHDSMMLIFPLNGSPLFVARVKLRNVSLTWLLVILSLSLSLSTELYTAEFSPKRALHTMAASPETPSRIMGSLSGVPLSMSPPTASRAAALEDMHMDPVPSLSLAGDGLEGPVTPSRMFHAKMCSPSRYGFGVDLHSPLSPAFKLQDQSPSKSAIVAGGSPTATPLLFRKAMQQLVESEHQ